MMKRSLSLVVTFALIGNVLFAQNVEQGKKFLYYERFKSAKETFDKVLASNPNNLEAVYWLGQTLLDKKNALRDTVAAKALYQKYLTQNGNAPLLLAGMGQIELMEGKTNEARQRFETALNLTKNKEVDVINAVATANVDAPAGDAAYAIEKLKIAPTIKKFASAETYMLLGDAYRKLIDGGNAVTSYTKALELDPKHAAAKNSIGRVYLTQNNPEYFLPAFEDAIKLDPAYAPTYYELFYYWYFRDVNKAAPYLDQYVANSDQGPDQEYLKADFLYASSKFAEAKAKAQELITQLGDKASPRMYRMLAYVNDTLGDLAGAKQAMTTFFAKATPEDVLPMDYEELGRIAAKTPGSEAEAFTNFQKAIELDTVAANKVKYIQKAADLAKKLRDSVQVANWLGMAYKIDPDPSQKALYDWGFANYTAKNYATADSIFCNVYQTKYPDQIYGYLWCARTAVAKDTTLEQGLYVEPFKKLIAFTDTIPDSARVKLKNIMIESHTYLAQYYANVTKQNDSAIAALEKILVIDPSKTEIAATINQLKNPPKPKQPAQKPAGSKPATTPKKKAATGK
ncbi:MAG: tetratricopeptide repeat protein [Chitinophagaceae bacterium]|nr:MAG: tetratricopeptide repeat protein [Chitinophagaceae bacterium]